MADLIALGLIYLAAIPATIFPFLYSRSPWEKSLVGRALMVSSFSLFLLIDISIVYQIFGSSYPGRDLVRNAVYFGLAAGCYLNLFALLKARRQHHPDIEHTRGQ